MRTICRSTVWFRSPLHLAEALSGNVSHPRIFWTVPEVFPIGFAYFDLAGALLGAMLSLPMKADLCTKVWREEKTPMETESFKNGGDADVLQPLMEKATSILKNIFHACTCPHPYSRLCWLVTSRKPFQCTRAHSRWDPI